MKNMVAGGQISRTKKKWENSSVDKTHQTSGILKTLEFVGGIIAKIVQTLCSTRFLWVIIILTTSPFSLKKKKTSSRKFKNQKIPPLTLEPQVRGPGRSVFL